MNSLDVVNICPICHSVTYGDDGWRYANKYNSTRFCLICDSAMDTYRAGFLSDREINRHIEAHKDMFNCD